MTTITPEEMHRRRAHVKAAIANSRLEGIATSAATQDPMFVVIPT
jgi:hypothetical protein